MVDAMAEMRRESERDGGGTYIEFSKNRNGNVATKLYYQLTGSQIIYSNIEAVVEEEAEGEIDYLGQDYWVDYFIFNLNKKT